MGGPGIIYIFKFHTSLVLELGPFQNFLIHLFRLRLIFGWREAGDNMQCFFSQNCEVGGLVITHPQEDLAKFGYRSERKVEKFTNHVYFGDMLL